MKAPMFCGLLVAALTCCRASVILSIQPASQSASLGSQASVDLDVSGLGHGTALGTYDVNVGFDPAVLAYSGIVFGNQLDIFGLGDIQIASPGIGTLDIFELSLDSPTDLVALQAPSFTLATITFDTVGPGLNSPLVLSSNALGDAFGNPISALTESGSVSVTGPTAVPEPGYIPIVLALAALIAVMRRLRGTKTAL